MDSSLFDLTVYCYDISSEGFLQEFKECVTDADNTYSVVMDFVIQRKVFLSELKSIRKSLDSENFYGDRVTDNTDSYISFVDDDSDMYNLDISYSNSLDDYDLRVQFNISSALLNVINLHSTLFPYSSIPISSCMFGFSIIKFLIKSHCMSVKTFAAVNIPLPAPPRSSIS